MPGTESDAIARRRERLRLIGLAAASTVVAAAVALLVAGTLVDRREEPADVADILTPVPSPGLIAEDPSGEAVPADVTFTYFDGREGSLADFAGRPLVVNFFASWCGPCKEELPAFAAVHGELGDEVAFVGLNPNDSVELATETAEAAGVTFDLATDPRSGELFAALGGSLMPHTVFISADQRIVAVHRGALTADELRDTIRDRLLS